MKHYFVVFNDDVRFELVCVENYYIATGNLGRPATAKRITFKLPDGVSSREIERMLLADDRRLLMKISIIDWKGQEDWYGYINIHQCQTEDVHDDNEPKRERCQLIVYPAAVEDTIPYVFKLLSMLQNKVKEGNWKLYEKSI